MNFTLINMVMGSYLFAGICFFLYTNFKKTVCRSFATILLSIGFVSHSGFLIQRWISAGHFPIIGLYESLLFFSWSTVCVFFILLRNFRLEFLAMPVSIGAALIVGYTSILDKAIKPLMPALKSNWIVIHVVSYFLGYASVAISCIVSIRYLIKARTVSPDSLTDLDTLSYRLIAFAFPFLTIGLTTGAVWAKTAWGSYWSWDPKETWALITWCVYAAYLHLRLLKNWHGRRGAFINIIGFFCVLFTFFGVNYLFKGLHSYL